MNIGQKSRYGHLWWGTGWESGLVQIMSIGPQTGPTPLWSGTLNKRSFDWIYSLSCALMPTRWGKFNHRHSFDKNNKNKVFTRTHTHTLTRTELRGNAFSMGQNNVEIFKQSCFFIPQMDSFCVCVCVPHIKTKLNPEKWELFTERQLWNWEVSNRKVS